jgi:hypothetical protein
MKSTIKFLPLVVVLLLSGSCASIVSKSKWPIAVGSTPPGATIQVTNKKGSEVYTGTTPAAFRLKSGAGFFSKESYRVKLSMPGFNEEIIPVECKLNSWYAGNLLLGGVIGGLIVDPATGAMYKLKTNAIHENLSPSSSLSFKPENKTPTKIAHHDGRAVIFVNGFRFGFSRRRDEKFQNKLKKKYWNIENPTFTREVNEYFEESENHFVNASYWKGSKAKDREAYGYFKGMEMITSGEIKLSQANSVMTIVMHSQGNAYGIGIANGIVDKAKMEGKEVNVNLVFLSVHQPDDIKLTDEMKKRGIQFTYLNDNAKIVAPIGKLKDVEDANVEKKKWKKSGLKAHSATVDDKNAFTEIKMIDNLKRIFTRWNEDENLASRYSSNSRSELFIIQIEGGNFLKLVY